MISEYTNANNDLSAAQENYNQAQNAYAQAKADRESFEAAILGTVNGLAVSTDRSLSDIEADLNAAGTYIEDLDQWVAKPGQQETLNNLLYEQRLAWKQQAEAVNKQYTKGDQITAATAASFGEGLDQFDTNTKISIYKLFGLDVPDYLLVKSPLAIQNEKTLENASGTLKTIGELSQIAGNAAPTMVLSMLFPASALGELGTVAKILGKVATSSSVYSSAYGGAYAQARNEGKTDTEASTYGVLSGASEVFLGEALGALAKGGSKFLSKKLENTVLGAMKNNASKAINEILGNSQTASAAAAIIKNMGKEAAEEYFQYALDPLMQNISFDGEDYTAKEMLTNAFSKEAFHSALLGALSSGTSQMTGLAVNGVASKLTGKGGLLNEQNLSNLTESEAKEVNNALTSAYAGMLENEGYRNIEEYRKQAEKTNANKKTAITHALAIGAELSQAIKNRIGQVGEKAAQIEKQSGMVKANQGIAESGEIASSLDLQQGLKTEGEVPNQTNEAETQTQQDSAELLKGEEDGGRIETEKPNFKTNQEVFENLQKTESFVDQKAVNHVLLGEINPAGKAVGFHYEGMPEAKGKIVEGTKSAPDEHGIYSGKVEVGGVAKKLNNGESSFFPKEWTPQQVIDAINEAYVSRELYSGSKYKFIGETKEGISIVIYLDDYDKILSVYPVYQHEVSIK